MILCLETCRKKKTNFRLDARFWFARTEKGCRMKSRNVIHSSSFRLYLLTIPPSVQLPTNLIHRLGLLFFHVPPLTHILSLKTQEGCHLQNTAHLSPHRPHSQKFKTVGPHFIRALNTQSCNLARRWTILALGYKQSQNSPSAVLCLYLWKTECPACQYFEMGDKRKLQIKP